jgi:hypothetical protein
MNQFPELYASLKLGFLSKISDDYLLLVEVTRLHRQFLIMGL